MNSLRRLFYTYYLSSVFTIICTVLCILFFFSAIGFSAFQILLLNDYLDRPEFLQRWIDQDGVYLSLWTTVFSAYCWFFLLLASVLMPVTIESILKGKSFQICPSVKVQMFLTVVLMSIFSGAIFSFQAWSFIFGIPDEVRPNNERIIRAFFIGFSGFVSYLWAFLVIGKAQGIWKLLSIFLVILGVGLPLQSFDPSKETLFNTLVSIGAVCWILFIMVSFKSETVRDFFNSLKSKIDADNAETEMSFKKSAIRMRYVFGLLRLRPALMALVQVSTVIVAGWFLPNERAWLVYFVSFGAISGVMSNMAVLKSRFFWLRDESDRTQLWNKVERVYLRHYLQFMSISVVAFLSVSIYYDFAIRTIFLGLPLLILSSMVSFYLGLFLTRGKTWLDSLAVLASLPLMILGAFFVDVAVPLALPIVCEIFLIGELIGFRKLSKNKWQSLDWTVCHT